MFHSTGKDISQTVGLINLAELLRKVSQAFKLMGFSRDTFYRYKEIDPTAPTARIAAAQILTGKAGAVSFHHTRAPNHDVRDLCQWP